MEAITAVEPGASKLYIMQAPRRLTEIERNAMIEHIVTSNLMHMEQFEALPEIRDQKNTLLAFESQIQNGRWRLTSARQYLQALHEAIIDRSGCMRVVENAQQEGRARRPQSGPPITLPEHLDGEFNNHPC